MNANQISNCIEVAIGFFALACLWHFGWRQLAIDAFRQDLFEARDRLFDIAALGDGSGFGFGHPVYGGLRRQFNGAIRFAHRLNMIQICAFLVCRLLMGPRVKFDELIQPLEKQLEDVDCATQAQILKVKAEWDTATLRYLMRTSPLFYLAFVLLVVRYFVVALACYLAKKVTLPKRGFRGVSEQISCTVWQDVAMVDYVEQIEADARLDRHSPAGALPV